MDGLDLFEHSLWRPFAYFGVEHPFFDINLSTLVYTWIALGILFSCALVGRYSLYAENSVAAFVAKKYVRAFMKLVHQSFDHFNEKYCLFICSLFTFILLCNIVVVIPGLEEPTKDLNTTLAFAVTSFFYTQKEALKAHGIAGYIQEFMKMPFTLVTPHDHQRPALVRIVLIFVRGILNMVVGLATLPLEVLGKVASVISLSFRLFGNIFGGSMIHHLWHTATSGSLLFHLFGLLGVNLIIMLFFGLFEGFVQAFVFSVLSLTYLAMAVRHEDEQTEHS